MSLYICPNLQNAQHQVNPNGNKMITMCQCRFICCNKRTMWWCRMTSVGGCACMGAREYWETLISAQFYHEPKTTLKNKVYFFKGNKLGKLPPIRQSVKIRSHINMENTKSSILKTLKILNR